MAREMTAGRRSGAATGQARLRAAPAEQRLAWPSQPVGQRRRIIRRPLIVGEAPSRTSDPVRPITGSCGRRLAALADVPSPTFRRRFALVNLLPSWPGRAVWKGAWWDARRARAEATAMARRRLRSRIVVLLGHRVGAAFGVHVGYFEPTIIGDALVIVVPHPSGVNRWYNAPANVARMRRFMRAIARGGLEPFRPRQEEEA